MEDDSDALLLHRDRALSSINSENDVVYESGNYELPADDTTPEEEPINSTTTTHTTRHTTSSSSDRRKQRWELNYHEAAIYLQEGANNDKFASHPRRQDAIPAYLLTHNMPFYALDLVAALLIMALAVIEEPAVLTVPIWIHGTLELIALLIIALELCMRMKWLGYKAFFRHGRTLLKVLTLLIMVAEAITVLVRQSSHMRVTRALRPLFLLDSFYLRDVRRFIRQIVQSLQPIFDMLVLLLFFMLMFAILGFYLFSTVPNDTYFNTIQTSFVSLFVLLTTANFPDVMLPTYAWSRWAAIFFITYLSLELYFLMNLFLAVVYDAFLKIEKDKLRKLLVHKRAACQFAFKLLVSREHPNNIHLRHFFGLLQFYKPSLSRRDCYLAFKCLNRSQSGRLSLDEFYEVYDVCSLKWKQKRTTHLWSSHFRSPFDKAFKAVHLFVTLKWFDYFVYLVIVANFIWILGDTIHISIVKSNAEDPGEWIRTEYTYLWVSIVFVAVYLVECLLKILGLGPTRYFNSGWNIFDFVVTMVATVGIIFQLSDQKFYYMLVLRPFRLLRLFKLKRRFRDVLGTLFILLPRMVSIAIVIMVLYYFFGIIGMEVFSKYDMRNCCVNTSVEVFYRYNNVTEEYGYYYLNNFDNILISGVTLFELTVVNNWYIIMEGYAAEAGEPTRLYFMLIYIVLMVVMTIVVAFVLEAFLFRIQYRKRMHGHDVDDDAVKKVEVALSPEEMQMCSNHNLPLTAQHIIHQATTTSSSSPAPSPLTPSTPTAPIPPSASSVSIVSDAGSIESIRDAVFVDPALPRWAESIRFRGSRLRSKDDFNLRMYRDEVKAWLAEEERRKREQAAELQEMPSVNMAASGDHAVASHVNRRITGYGRERNVVT